jgi:hypothetical protein
VTPPQDDQNANATVFKFQFSGVQFYSALSAILLAFLGLLYIIYGGIRDDIKEVKGSVTALSDSYREAVTSGIKVQELITKAPTLEKTISETHDAVIKVQGGVELLNQKVDANQQQTKIQLDNIQKQVHSK